MRHTHTYIFRRFCFFGGKVLNGIHALPNIRNIKRTLSRQRHVFVSLYVRDEYTGYGSKYHNTIEINAYHHHTAYTQQISHVANNFAYDSFEQRLE